MRRARAAAWIAGALSLAACDSYGSSYGKTYADAAPAASDGAPGSGFRLTIDNVLDWCDITVDGTVYRKTSPPPRSYPAGTIVHLGGAPTSATFIWGYWTGTDAAASPTAKDPSTTATVTMSADRTIKACCPFADGSGC
jgi:hypothetical protein